MKLLQFSQKKTESDWMSLIASTNLTKLDMDLKKIHKGEATWKSFFSKWVKHKIAELMYEYYSILFNPDNAKYFWTGFVDITLLFPTAETLYIKQDTNYILFPFPLPTYNERTCRWLKTINYPFLLPHIATDEFIRDTDYRIDSIYSKERKPSWKQRLKDYPHLNPDIKHRLMLEDLECGTKLWTYKFNDMTDNERKRLWYEDKPYSLRDVPNYLINRYVERKYTLLEITPPNSQQNNFIANTFWEPFSWRDKDENWVSEKNKAREYRMKLFKIRHDNPDKLINLKDYAKYFLVFSNKIDYNFYAHIFIRDDNKEAMIKYFEDNIYHNQFSIPEIRAWIKKLNDYIKYLPKNKIRKCKAEEKWLIESRFKQLEILNDREDRDQYVKFDQKTRWIAYKWFDWNRVWFTYKE